jgi:hypothetical protein
MALHLRLTWSICQCGKFLLHQKVMLATFCDHICQNDSFCAHAQCACAPNQSFNIGPSGHFVEVTERTLMANANFSGRFGNRTSDLQAFIDFLSILNTKKSIYSVIDTRIFQNSGISRFSLVFHGRSALVPTRQFIKVGRTEQR